MVTFVPCGRLYKLPTLLFVSFEACIADEQQLLLSDFKH
jgi:hypothetical protein